MKKAELAHKLSELEGFSNPRISLEQYMTTPSLAADMVYIAYMNGDMEESVADLGAGTGILAIGAALMGAEVAAVEKDPDAIEIARESAEELDVKGKIEFVESEVRDFSGSFDTVLMNPPFSVHSDTGFGFLEKAFEIASSVYTLSNRGSRERIKDFAGQSSHEIRAVEPYTIALPATFGFHTEESRETEIDLIVTRRTNNGA